MQLVWDAIEELPREQLKQDVHVISTDTLVETPYIIDYVATTLEQINQTARASNLPIYAHRLTPLPKNSFWVNLIGKGYPAPSRNFRWCTERLKIEPVTVISKNSLSSGELEIYAMAMLWALAKTSGQKLPFIVDTPLARLDSKHRDNLIKLFFPHASHQMMIFSTNTEVDQQYFNQLRPHVAHAYNLEFCEESKSTVVKEGYFWN